MSRRRKANIVPLGKGKCEGCDKFGPIDDIGLCRKCGRKLDRDMIRLRDWDYSVSAFAVPHAEREKLREAVIEKHGEKLELIVHPDEVPEEVRSQGHE